MKRILAVLVLLLIPAYAYCSDPSELSQYSGEKTADSAIMTVGARVASFDGIVVMPDGTNSVTVSIYDNASAGSGSEIVPTLTFAGDGGAQAFSPPRSVRVYNGIYVDVTVAGGGSVAYSIYYRK